MLLKLLIDHKINPAIILPVLEQGLEQEKLHAETQKLLQNDREYMKAELRISQTELLICLLRFKAQ